MAKKFQVRFNLGAGENYKKWKVTSPKGAVQYLEPSEVTIFMENCKLVNRKATAQKIHDGANKEVCAWVEAEAVTIYHKMPNDFVEGGVEVAYNPKVVPYWVKEGKDVDKQMVGDLITMGREIFTK
jgi:hypothetical protein